VFTVGCKARQTNRSERRIAKWAPVVSDATTMAVGAAFEQH
jgi:hypothetical protein